MRGARSSGVPAETGTCVPFLQDPPLDVEIGELARRQHGVVTLHQLRLAGLTASAVRKRVKAGRLYRVHRAVYAVGYSRLTGHGRTMAAVLAYGPTAVASHRTAAGLQGLRADNSATTDVSLPQSSVHPRPRIRAHAMPSLRPTHVTTCEGIPCTTVARTLLDLADVVPRRQLERALEQAEVSRVFDLGALEHVLVHANGRAGAALLRDVLGELRDDPGLTASEYEDRYLELCRAAGLPRPEVNRWLRVDEGPPVKADFLWPEQRLIVEIDGWASHGTRQGFEHDRRRDQRVRLAGWEPVRFSGRQVVRDPGWVTATTAALIAR